jgi:hypothetical protein
MKLTANGIERSLSDWARCLGVSDYAITHAIAEGLTMQEVADAYSTDTFAAPSTPPNRPSTPPRTQSLPEGVLQTPGGTFTFRALCLQCADQAKQVYDLNHRAHRQQMALEARAAERAWNDTMFDFVNFEGADAAASPSVQSQASQDQLPGPQADSRQGRGAAGPDGERVLR